MSLATRWGIVFWHGRSVACSRRPSRRRCRPHWADRSARPPADLHSPRAVATPRRAYSANPGSKTAVGYASPPGDRPVGITSRCAWLGVVPLAEVVSEASSPAASSWTAPHDYCPNPTTCRGHDGPEIFWRRPSRSYAGRADLSQRGRGRRVRPDQRSCATASWPRPRIPDTAGPRRDMVLPAHARYR